LNKLLTPAQKARLVEIFTGEAPKESKDGKDGKESKDAKDPKEPKQ
jgi:hypothetical protein